MHGNVILCIIINVQIVRKNMSKIQQNSEFIETEDLTFMQLFYMLINKYSILLFREWRNLCFRGTHGNGETSIDRYHAGRARVCRKTIGEQISRWLAWFKSSLKFRRVVPRMLSTSNWRLTPGRRDGSSFRQIRAAVKHRISIPSVSAFPSHMINISYMYISFVHICGYALFFSKLSTFSLAISEPIIYSLYLLKF